MRDRGDRQHWHHRIEKRWTFALRCRATASGQSRFQGTLRRCAIMRASCSTGRSASAKSDLSRSALLHWKAAPMLPVPLSCHKRKRPRIGTLVDVRQGPSIGPCRQSPVAALPYGRAWQGRPRADRVTSLGFQPCQCSLTLPRVASFLTSTETSP